MDFAITLDYKPDVPLYKQLCDAILDCIQTGRLKPGEYLPSTRELARLLSISRVTVVRSYEELLSQGYLVASIGMGTCVAKTLPDEAKRLRRAPDRAASEEREMRQVTLSSYGRRVMKYGHARSGSADFPELNFGAAPLEYMPVKQWRQSILKHCKTDSDLLPSSDASALGEAALRDALVSYLSRARGLRCQRDQVVVFSGSQQAVNLIAALLVDEGDIVAVENPGFPHSREVFLAHGAALRPISVDAQGLIVDELQQLENCRLVYVTPSHQDPTGAVLSVERRRQLLDWAQRTGAMIVEDDYDSEYRYGGQPIPALQGLDHHDSVIYLSTFWKVLFPLLPAGFMVVPRNLISAVTRAKDQRERTFPLLEQLALADFINEGHLERYLRKTRDAYAKRRQALVYAMTLHFGKSAIVSRETGGMHLVARVSSTLSDDELLDCAFQNGLPMVSTSDYYLEGECRGEFLIGFAHVAAEQIGDSIRNFADLIKSRESVTATS